MDREDGAHLINRSTPIADACRLCDRQPHGSGHELLRLGERGDGGADRAGLALRLRAAQGQGVEAAEHDAGAEARGVSTQADLGEPLQQHLQHDASLKTRQRGTEAMVDAVPERQVGRCAAPDIEPVRVRERLGAAVGRAEQQHDVVAPAQRESVHVAVGKSAPERRLHRRVVTQQLFDRIGLRHDGGDAETGVGLDVGSGLVLADASTGLSVDLRVRMLVLHQAEGFRERGLAVSLSYTPTPSTPLGLSARPTTYHDPTDIPPTTAAPPLCGPPSPDSIAMATG